MKVVDIDYDDDTVEELTEVYNEARRQIDETIPRVGYNQADWLNRQGLDFLVNWIEAHNTLDFLNDELGVKYE